MQPRQSRSPPLHSFSFLHRQRPQACPCHRAAIRTTRYASQSRQFSFSRLPMRSSLKDWAILPCWGVAPPSAPCKGSFIRPATGGKPVPDPRPTPRSLHYIAPPAQPAATQHEPLYHQWTYREHFAEPNPAPRYTHELTLPRKAQVVLPTTSQLQGQDRMRRCIAKFMQCIEIIGDTSALHIVRKVAKHHRSMWRACLASSVPRLWKNIWHASQPSWTSASQTLSERRVSSQCKASQITCCHRNAPQCKTEHPSGYRP